MSGRVPLIQSAIMNCDRIAPYYEIVERLSFGKQLDRRRFAFLGEMRSARRAIVCGGGDGRFLARLLRVNARVEVDFVDLSSRMTALAEQRIAAMGPTFHGRVRFHTGDVRDLDAPVECYDLIVTHYFLDCFSDKELENVVARLANWGRSHVRWIVSDFREGDGPIGRVWTRAVIRGLYLAFRFTTGLRVNRLPEYQAALARAGYILRFEEDGLAGLLHSSLWEMGNSQA